MYMNYIIFFLLLLISFGLIKIETSMLKIKNRLDLLENKDLYSKDFDNLSDEIIKEIKKLKNNNQETEAIYLLKTETNCSLTKCKSFIENI